MIAIAVTLEALMAQLPPTQCSAVTSYDHQTGYNMENDPESSEGERLSNIWLFDWKEFRFVVIGSSNWHTDCSGPNFDPSSLSTHVRDGDTIEVNGIAVRLSALDCPENSTRQGKQATKIA